MLLAHVGAFRSFLEIDHQTSISYFRFSHDRSDSRKTYSSLDFVFYFQQGRIQLSPRHLPASGCHTESRLQSFRNVRNVVVKNEVVVDQLVFKLFDLCGQRTNVECWTSQNPSDHFEQEGFPASRISQYLQQNST